MCGSRSFVLNRINASGPVVMCAERMPNSVHSNHSRHVRDLDMASDEYLPGCGVPQGSLSEMRLSVMAEAAFLLRCRKTRDASPGAVHFQAVQDLTVQEVSEHLAIDKKTVKAIDLAGLEAALRTGRLIIRVCAFWPLTKSPSRKAIGT